MLSEEAKKVKEELENLRALEQERARLQSRLSVWEDTSNALKGASLSPMIQGGVYTPYAELRLEKMEELLAHLKICAEELAQREMKIRIAMSKLDPDSKRLLEARYVDGLKISKLANKFNYSERAIKYKQAAAIEKLAENESLH